MRGVRSRARAGRVDASEADAAQHCVTGSGRACQLDTLRSSCVASVHNAPPARPFTCPRVLLPPSCRFNYEAFKWLLAQSAAEALMKFGIQPRSSSGFVLNMPLNVA